MVILDSNLCLLFLQPSLPSLITWSNFSQAIKFEMKSYTLNDVSELLDLTIGQYRDKSDIL